ncbi:4a-hydroxytetrahydrobiopterin dehydratase [Conexibacter sp. SYSU D00693]|uniref:4a-hydroxytetrahydrobiopterin dehydratase n=1 Tax=Conexibacter sp. SYSU D00693 TaxID=2812560 RepID=UPI00196B5921|nr:4a-hydroxytetrahydrobiopterin dehydratase [Conexibacter sp. SYSU D00693]
MALLTDEAVDAGLERLEGWRREGDELVKDLHLGDFRAVIALVDRVADAAEDAGHHPDLLVHGYNRLRLSLSTHSEGGITQADLDLAATIDGLA